jgi:hypothetical protein
MTNFLLGALGVGIGIGPAIFAHMIGILIVAGVVWLGTILGSEQGIAGTVAMRSAFGINGRYREISAPCPSKLGIALLTESSLRVRQDQGVAARHSLLILIHPSAGKLQSHSSCEKRPVEDGLRLLQYSPHLPYLTDTAAEKEKVESEAQEEVSYQVTAAPYPTVVGAASRQHSRPKLSLDVRR